MFWRRASRRRNRFASPAIKAVGVLGDAANVALLAERAARTSGDEQAAARESLRVLRGKNVHAEMIRRIEGADSAVRVELMQALADRRATEATPVLLQMAASNEASVRTASYRALRELAGASDAEALVALLVDAKDGEQKQLENTILGVARRANAAAETSKAVMAKLDSVRDAQLKGTMIGILGQLGDASALATMRRALSDADVEIRYAAIAGLGRWPNAEPLPDLLRVAGDKSNASCQVRALGAYIDLVAAVASMPAGREGAVLQDRDGSGAECGGEEAGLAALWRMSRRSNRCNWPRRTCRMRKSGRKRRWRR